MSNLQKALNKAQATFKEFTFECQKYHWFVKGKYFYTLHDLFEKQYDWSFATEDKIVEHGLRLGLTPLVKTSEIAAQSPLKRLENLDELTNEKITQLFLVNLKKLLEVVKELNEVADDEDISTIEALTDDLMDEIEESIWKFETFLA